MRTPRPRASRPRAVVLATRRVELKQISFQLHGEMAAAAAAASTASDAHGRVSIDATDVLKWCRTVKAINKLVTRSARASREREARLASEVAIVRCEAMREVLELEAVMTQTLEHVAEQNPNAVDRAVRAVSAVNAAMNGWLPSDIEARKQAEAPVDEVEASKIADDNERRGGGRVTGLVLRDPESEAML